jgi:hypothetical protein
MSDQFSTFLCPAVEPCASWTGGWNAELLYTSLFVSSSHGLPNICRDRMRNQKNFSVSNRLVRGPGKEVRLHPTLTSMLFAVRVFQTVVPVEYTSFFGTFLSIAFDQRDRKSLGSLPSLCPVSFAHPQNCLKVFHALSSSPSDLLHNSLDKAGSLDEPRIAYYYASMSKSPV